MFNTQLWTMHNFVLIGVITFLWLWAIKQFHQNHIAPDSEQ